MANVEEFLTVQEEKEIVEAIIKAEMSTTGEIRVHLESGNHPNAMQRAKEVFHAIKMDNTKESNGVLIYIAISDKKFVIYGDDGINKVVPDDFWENTKNAIQDNFKKGAFKDGIMAGVLTAGEALQKYFPWHTNDTNELSNEISKG